MNIKITSLTFLIAAVAGMSFSQAAYAADGRGMRFDYNYNEYALEAPTGRRGGRAAARMPHTEVAPIAANSMPKSLLMDKDFISKPAPPPPAPIVAAVPIAKPSTSMKASIPNLFNSVFNPVKSDALAAGPSKLADFGNPIVAKLPTPPMPKAPTIRTSTNTAIAWKQPRRPTTVAMRAPEAFKMPAVMRQGSGYQIGQNIPMNTITGTSAHADVHGKVLYK
ncbi:MAG: hypothetical protein P4L53_25100 [Candidatus Obscuribacterales bacterium]|nr:hypothetical protein [Candidatus Obscuribacterales bacterium]